MSKGKYQNKKHNRGTKTLVMLLALVLTLGGTISGTVAWLTAQTTAVTNTFTVGNINIDLNETDADEDGDSKNNDYKMIPGKVLSKDPYVTVEANSEACWLFVKVEETGTSFTPDGDTMPQVYAVRDFLEYEIAEGWTALSSVPGVYYRTVDAATAKAGYTYYVLKDNSVTVKPAVTKEMMDVLTEDNYPKLTFTAYAIQSEYLKNASGDDVEDAAAAWALIQPNTPTT